MKVAALTLRRWLFCVAILLLAACQSESAAPTPTIGPPAAGTPSALSSPTATLLPGPVISTPGLPATTPVAGQPTAVLQPTQSIPGLIGPANFPPNVNPLTGETVADPAVLQRRPIAIKISNIARVRPQSGLNSADLLYEHYTEGGITRFTALFYDQDAAKVGSVRSARLIDLEIPVMYDAAFAYSGASGPVRLMLRDSAFFNRVISPDFGHGGFDRISDPNNPGQFFEDTLFTNTAVLRSILDQRGENRPPVFQNGMAFHPTPPAGGVPASALEVTYLATDAFWQYNPATGRYTRWSDGVPHLDAATGQQLDFKNIIVLAAHHEDTDIVEDTNGFFSIQIQIWGEGPVSIFRDGQRFEGRWRRATPGEMLTFYDLQGNILPLAPGNTFFQIVPLGF
ncbi:MAG: DUF3048 domain-containing protein, partial [Chloroflexi bacterium]|nr:DUF3048 domain-containing protein [Chloroflexota bacterium]